MAHTTHIDHTHMHSAHCGHTAIEHDDHTDYVHNGHLHTPHESHYDEHVIAVDATHPNACSHVMCDCGHDDCGHETIPHGDHVDHLYNGQLHHRHGDHCDLHGNVAVK